MSQLRWQNQTLIAFADSLNPDPVTVTVFAAVPPVVCAVSIAVLMTFQHKACAVHQTSVVEVTPSVVKDKRCVRETSLTSVVMVILNLVV
jgi:hypothetical protein